jgi:hypothetical protein
MLAGLGSTPEYLAAAVRRYHAHMVRLIKQAGIKEE